MVLKDKKFIYYSSSEKYMYPALFETYEDGGYTVSFPDLSGCITEGDSLTEALAMAKEALELFLWNMEHGR